MTTIFEAVEVDITDNNPGNLPPPMNAFELMGVPPEYPQGPAAAPALASAPVHAVLSAPRPVPVPSRAHVQAVPVPAQAPAPTFVQPPIPLTVAAEPAQEEIAPSPTKRRGRPPGSKNKDQSVKKTKTKAATTASPKTSKQLKGKEMKTKRGPGRPKKATAAPVMRQRAKRMAGIKAQTQIPKPWMKGFMAHAKKTGISLSDVLRKGLEKEAKKLGIAV